MQLIKSTTAVILALFVSCLLASSFVERYDLPRSAPFVGASSHFANGKEINLNNIYEYEKANDGIEYISGVKDIKRQMYYPGGCCVVYDDQECTSLSIKPGRVFRFSALAEERANPSEKPWCCTSKYRQTSAHVVSESCQGHGPWVKHDAFSTRIHGDILSSKLGQRLGNEKAVQPQSSSPTSLSSSQKSIPDMDEEMERLMRGESSASHSPHHVIAQSSKDMDNSQFVGTSHTSSSVSQNLSPKTVKHDSSSKKVSKFSSFFLGRKTKGSNSNE